MTPTVAGVHKPQMARCLDNDHKHQGDVAITRHGGDINIIRIMAK